MYYVIETREGFPETIAEYKDKADAEMVASSLMQSSGDFNVHYEVTEEPYGALFHGLDLRTI